MRGVRAAEEVTSTAMSAVRIVSDSACDLPGEVADDLEISIVPLTIRFGTEEFVDRVELSAHAFYEKLRKSRDLPQTAAPAPGAFEKTYRELAARGTTAIVSIHLSSDLSATLQSAKTAAAAVADEIDVRVIDSRSITAGLGHQVLEAAELAREGASVDAIVDHVMSLIPRTHVVGTLDTLEYLKRGGRIGGAQALVGSMLSIKPILDLSNGVVEEAGKARTRRKALQRLLDFLPPESRIARLAVMHADASDIDDFVELLRTRVPPDRMTVGIIGAVIGTHGGPGTVGLCWLEQDVTDS
ncbi:MAG: hypothetical protein KatS3mg008_1426 [Acidimicrobiales bacterium]|nr:MAG: hypothetical protein KatS3mg008_1426 [Acidimicrobiales bacterium]